MGISHFQPYSSMLLGFSPLDLFTSQLRSFCCSSSPSIHLCLGRLLILSPPWTPPPPLPALPDFWRLPKWSHWSGMMECAGSWSFMAKVMSQPHLPLIPSAPHQNALCASSGHLYAVQSDELCLTSPLGCSKRNPHFAFPTDGLKRLPNCSLFEIRISDQIVGLVPSGMHFFDWMSVNLHVHIFPSLRCQPALWLS